MKIKKVLNNNAILVGENGRDAIWLGTGVGFRMKPGLVADKSKVEKIFVLEEKNSFQRLEKLIISIPIEYFSLADDIIHLAKDKLDSTLSELLYVSLTDHLYNLIKLYKRGIVPHNRLFWEIKKIYPKEFEIGQQALRLIEEKMDVRLEEEEASNIAMHLINAQLNDTKNTIVDGRIIAKKIRDIIAIIRLSNQLSINEASLAYNRFITHLRFFFQRLNASEDKSKSNPLLLHVKEQYYQAFQTMKLVENYLEIPLNDDEQLYLTLHIQKLIEND